MIATDQDHQEMTKEKEVVIQVHHEIITVRTQNTRIKKDRNSFPVDQTKK